MCEHSVDPTAFESIESDYLVPLSDEKALEAVYDFGKLMVSLATQRIVQQDAKLRTLLGWSIALFVFGSVGISKDIALADERNISQLLSFLSTVLAGVALYFSHRGAKGREWSGPSEQDWFNTSLLEGAKIKDERLLVRKYYVKQLHATHHGLLAGIRDKGESIRYAERFLLASAFLAMLAAWFARYQN